MFRKFEAVRRCKHNALKKDALLDNVFDFFEWLLLNLEEAEYKEVCNSTEKNFKELSEDTVINPEKGHVPVEGLTRFTTFLEEIKLFLNEFAQSKKSLKGALLIGIK